MRLRSLLLLLFLLPLVIGLISLAKGAAVPAAPQCPGLATDQLGEDRPSEMQPGVSCTLSYKRPVDGHEDV